MLSSLAVQHSVGSAENGGPFIPRPVGLLFSDICGREFNLYFLSNLCEANDIPGQRYIYFAPAHDPRKLGEI
jgi:hypothetical protein